MPISLHSDGLTLRLIDEDNFGYVCSLLEGYEDREAMLEELKENYLSEYEKGVRVKYGFYTMLDNGELGGFCLLGIHNWHDRKGYTGADTLLHMRGQGIAPRTKPHLFYFAFAVLGLNRVESGYVVSNTASKRSILKTPGFVFEGVMRESGINANGEFEDEHLYAIIKRDWLKLYDRDSVIMKED